MPTERKAAPRAAREGREEEGGGGAVGEVECGGAEEGECPCRPCAREVCWLVSDEGLCGCVAGVGAREEAAVAQVAGEGQGAVVLAGMHLVVFRAWCARSDADLGCTRLAPVVLLYCF